MFRRRGLTRGAGPEHNLLQAPDLTRAVQQTAGLRQSHVAPVLADTVQPVIIADDVRDFPPTSKVKHFAAVKEMTGNGVLSGVVHLINPNGSGVIVIVRALYFSTRTPVNSDLVWTINNAYGGANPTPGVTLAQGTVPGTADPLVRTKSAAGMTPVLLNLPAPYIWQEPLSPAGAQAVRSIIFPDRCAPQLFAGGYLSFGWLDTSANLVVNAIWDEVSAS